MEGGGQPVWENRQGAPGQGSRGEGRDRKRLCTVLSIGSDFRQFPGYLHHYYLTHLPHPSAPLWLEDRGVLRGAAAGLGGAGRALPPGLPHTHLSWFVSTPVAWKGSYVPWGEQGLWEAARSSLSLLPRWALTGGV